MKMRLLHIVTALAPFTVLCGCDNLPGRPGPGAEVPRPQQVLSFQTLYQQNCAGCHGSDGQNGPATDLANPEYQALIDDASLRDIIAHGQQGVMMPGFAQVSGGPLTDKQVEVILKGIRSQWFKGNVLQGLNAPAYKTAATGNAARGQQIYSMNCARCHGAPGGPAGPKGSILDGSFLALVNEQTIRTTAIAGRPDLGMPDWRNQMPGHSMTDQDVTDTVAWVISQRPQTPGQPYPQRPVTAKTRKDGGS
jgi:cytochrome c oxidase cbb3-type subunit 3/ubiquinol-cytochrome c reductase cytochrome c subunit